ncbi:Protein kinase domain-containing protein [Mycena chlorophos]|uniref:Protein kinase domain-containing protein n=1 Tax=Mycena chlorophos TaxID=658473 RepID=A0A8H6VRQ4_MYCCL|nr:Protein kinase domain-containing protein [Mycena chlorophos]
MFDTPELGDFDIMQEIASGKHATVYLVNCKRGRLRNRQLALKKVVSPSSTEIKRLIETSNLHSSLSHPSVLSLLSTFSTPSANFQLLELALGGPLDAVIDGQPLSETHVRCIVKGVAEALLYLRKENIIHRNVQLSTILLATDGRPKLSGFGLATHSPPSKLPPDYFAESPHCVSPEILFSRPHSYEADWWSLGCVMLGALAGRLPFGVYHFFRISSISHGQKSASLEDTTAKILRGAYSTPANATPEAREVLSGLLDTNPKRRTPPNELLAYPFFDGPAAPLTLSSPNGSEDLLSKHALFESRSKRPSFPPLIPTPPRLRLTRRSLAPANQTNIDDARSTQKRMTLRDQLLSRRIVSDPLPPKPRLSSFSLLSRASPPSDRSRNNSLVKDSSPSPKTATSSPVPSHSLAEGHPRDQPLPIGTTRPVPFTTALLTPESHKTVHGHITVLPSRSLLVDFREAERRRGQKGNEVLVIDPHGLKVEIYAAPHLSVPCCLAEPIKRFKLLELPTTYWRQYNDAALLVERIKQRTPKARNIIPRGAVSEYLLKLILYLGSAQCTLMANSAPADIELLAGSSTQPSPRRLTDIESYPQTARLRIRLSRQQSSIELAKHVTSSRGESEEWTKRVFRTTKDESACVSATDWESLDDEEQSAMESLNQFWRLKIWAAFSVNACHWASAHQLAAQSSWSVGTATTTFDVPDPAAFSSSQHIIDDIYSRSASAFAFQHSRRATTDEVPDTSPSATQQSRTRRHPSVIGKTGYMPTWCKNDDDDAGPMPQTRFIPSVGWCIRQGSRVTQGGRYKIMFVDGAVLEIDVDEEWAELTEQDGTMKRYDLGRRSEMTAPIAERMRVFGEFVSMFEDKS